MKILTKITAVLNIIFGAHYLALAFISIISTGLATIISFATFSLSIIGGTLGLILAVILYLVLTVVYGMGGIWTLKNDKKKALICMMIAGIISLISLVIAIIHTKIGVTFVDVFALILPVAHGFLIIQSTDL